jgi:predicted nucleic acid-binding protein
MGLVLDSTVLIGTERASRSVVQLLQLLDKRFGDESITISAMTAAELIHGVWRASTPQMRALRETFVEEVFARIPVGQISLQTARIIGQIDARCRAKGSVIPTADLLIGATALELGFHLVTANVRHFKLIPGLKVVKLA